MAWLTTLVKKKTKKVTLRDTGFGRLEKALTTNFAGQDHARDWRRESIQELVGPDEWGPSHSETWHPSAVRDPSGPFLLIDGERLAGKKAVIPRQGTMSLAKNLFKSLAVAMLYSLADTDRRWFARASPTSTTSGASATASF